jgi:DNA primase
MNSDDIKEEIRRRVDIADLIGQYVPLQRAGSRLRARCPFHQEKTPSFYVDDARGYFKCFGCGAYGDIFSFVMQMEGLTFPEAAERLAQRAGVQWQPGPAAEKAGRERQTVLKANVAAAEYFARMLKQPEGAEAAAYLQQRGLSPETISEFGLGYAPAGWDGLLRHLAGQGFGEQVLAQAGLVRPRQSGGYYDFFRHRIMFPIVDVSGRVIAFGGRALDPEENAKYVNSPESSVFKKGSTFYGLHRARKPIADQSLALVVEGYMDVIALAQAGFGHVVACLGTATTEAHLRLLARYTDNICFVYDADAAGMQAALRNITVFEGSSASVRVAVLPAGQDPDDCIRSGGPEVFQRCVDESVSFVEYQIRMMFEPFDIRDTDGRLRAARQTVDVLVKVPDRERREEYLKRAADLWAGYEPARSEQMARVLRMELGKRLGDQRGPRAGRQAQDRGVIQRAVAATIGPVEPRIVSLERLVLTAALTNEAHCRTAATRLQPQQFMVPEHQQLAEKLLGSVSAEAFDPAAVIEILPEEEGLRALAVELLHSDPEEAQEVFAESLENLLLSLQAHGLRPEYLVEAEEDHADLAAGESEEDFASLEKKVAAAINAGEVSPDDPDVQRYYALLKRFRGKGRQGFIDNAGSTPLGNSASAEQLQRRGEKPAGADGVGTAGLEPEERS